MTINILNASAVTLRKTSYSIWIGATNKQHQFVSHALTGVMQQNDNQSEKSCTALSTPCVCLRNVSETLFFGVRKLVWKKAVWSQQMFIAGYAYMFAWCIHQFHHDHSLTQLLSKFIAFSPLQVKHAMLCLARSSTALWRETIGAWHASYAAQHTGKCTQVRCSSLSWGFNRMQHVMLMPPRW